MSLAGAIRDNDSAIAIIEDFTDKLLLSELPETATLNEIAYLDSEKQNIVRKQFVTLREKVADVIAHGIKRGELRPGVPSVGAAAIIGLVSWLPMARRWPTSSHFTAEHLIRAMKSMIRVGIAEKRSAQGPIEPLYLSPMLIRAVDVFETEVMSAARREAMLSAASWLFNLKGIYGTSLDEIALRLGVTRKVLFHNVGDKPSLVAACYLRSFHLYEEIAARVESYDGASVDAITVEARASAEATLRTDIAPLEPLAGFEALPAEVKTAIQESSASLVKTYAGIYRRGQADGTIRKFDPYLVLGIRPGVHVWLRTWSETFHEDELALAPKEIGEFVRVGLLSTE